MKLAISTILLLSCLTTQLALGKTVDDYETIINNHPKVLAITEQYSALTNQADGALGLPDPTIFAGVDNVPVSDPSFDQYLPSSKVIGFTQKLPNSGGREAQQDVFNSAANSTKLMADYTKSRLHALFITRLAELERIELQHKYEKKKQQTLAQLQENYEGKILAGEPIYQKNFLTEIEFADIDQRINTLNYEKTFVEAELIQLVGEVPQIQELPVEEKNWNGDLNRLYPVQLAALNIKTEQAKVELADSDYLPDFGITGAYKIREDGKDDMFEGDDWFSLQFSMTIPLWASKNQLPKLEAAKSRKRSAEYSHKEAIRKWIMETTRLESNLNTALINIEILSKKEISIKKKIDALERTYSAGQTGLEPVLQAELTRLTLLSQVAMEKERHIRLVQELNSHIEDNYDSETSN